MQGLFGASWRTSLGGYLGALLFAIMGISSLTNTPIPKIETDPTTNEVTVVRDENGNPVMTTPGPNGVEYLVLAAVLAGIGRAARDNKVDSESAGAKG